MARVAPEDDAHSLATARHELSTGEAWRLEVNAPYI